MGEQQTSVYKFEMGYIGQCSAGWPNGKALLSGGKDCGFESRPGRFF